MDSNQQPTIGLQASTPGNEGGVDPVAQNSPALSPAAVHLAQASAQPVHDYGTPPEADDAADEQLDQEWINKAKDVVEKTKHDPFLQSNELSKLKAGYMKIRYNKDLKIGEDSA